MSAIVCPKCHYVRRAGDTAPAWQCPSCGIAYAKFGDADAPGRNEPVAKQDLRERVLSASSRDRAGSLAMSVYFGMTFFFLLLIFIGGRHVQPWISAKWLPVVLAACAFAFWLAAYRRLRMVADVPTSTVAGAAQGYVELSGTAVAAPGDTLIGHLARDPCVWYRYDCLINEDGKNKAHVGERGTWFILRDGTGDCLVNAEEAEIVCDRCQVWRDSLRTCREWSIRAGDRVYAIGHFSAGSAGAERHLDLKAAVELGEMERAAGRRLDRQEGLAGLGELRREAVREYAAQGGACTLGPSPDGRPFMVIGADHDDVVSRYRWLTAAHLAVFFLALGAAAWFWQP